MSRPAKEKLPTETGPLGTGTHYVRNGECIESIAAESGHVVKTIWEASENSELKEKRKNPNTLLPGDGVHIPPLKKKEESCPAEQKHRFKRKGLPSKLVLVLKDEKGEPRKNLAYELHVDGVKKKGQTDGSGKLEQPISPRALAAELVIPSTKEKHSLQLRQLHPVSEPTGVQGRLRNLGYYLGKIDGDFGGLSRAALVQFQVAQKVDPTGKYDTAAMDKLKQAHGQ